MDIFPTAWESSCCKTILTKLSTMHNQDCCQLVLLHAYFLIEQGHNLVQLCFWHLVGTCSFAIKIHCFFLLFVLFFYIEENTPQ